MTFNIYAGGRRSGKTTMIVLWYRANPGAKIIVRNERERQEYFRSYGVPLSDIITLGNVYRGTIRASHRTKFALDGLDDVFQDALINLGNCIPGELEAASFDLERLRNPFFQIHDLDAAAMEHVAHELQETINDERRQASAEQANTPKKYTPEGDDFPFYRIDTQVQPGSGGGEG